MTRRMFQISAGFEEVMPPEYRELVEAGPFEKRLGIAEMGAFKELLEEHPLCAGCGLALSLRLTLISLPSPEDTIIVGATGCSSLAFPQVAVHNIHSLFGNQNAVATGLKRALSVRFPDRAKDVVVIAGDGATCDIGLESVMHSWFRGERLTTIMLDNEAYANTGGQESGMSQLGTVLNMAPKGKKFKKVAFPEVAKAAGCVYVAVAAPHQPRRLERSVRRAILIAREVGPTYVQLYTPCPTNYKFKPADTLSMIREQEKAGTFKSDEYLSPEAAAYIQQLEEAKG